MQLALSAEVLVPAGAGVMALAIATFVAVTRGWRRRPDAETTVEAAPIPLVAELAQVPLPVRRKRMVAAAARGPIPVQPDLVTGGDPRPGRTVADVVTRAIAARAAEAQRSANAGAATVSGSDSRVPATGRGDVRDRLLAVLLDDPVRVVGAALELEACCEQLDRLTDAVRYQRSVIAVVLRRLADAGLQPDQLARLSGLPADEVLALIERAATPAR